MIKEQREVERIEVRTISLLDRRELSVYLLKEMDDQPDGGWDDMIPDILDRIEYEELSLIHI